MSKWTRFPPTDDDEIRLKNYATLRKLMTSRHAEVYECLRDKDRWKQLWYLAVNFAGLTSKLCADMLFGEFPTITGDNQKQIDEIIADNALQTVCHTMALSSSYRGDCVFKVRRGRFQDWDEKEYPIIEAVPSHAYFPYLDQNNVMGVKGATIAWVREIGNDRYLRKEVHEPGRIINELYRMDSATNVGDQLLLKSLDETANLPEVQDTGFPGLLVEYVPNWRLDDEFWGISDYFDILSLQSELNNRMTKVRKILDKHSEPKLLLPPGIMKYDEKLQRWYVEKEDLEAIEVDPDTVGDLPKYLTWDAQLSACFDEIERLLEFMCLVTETAPSAIGLTGKDGGQAESGKALRFRLMRTLGKIDRKKRFFDQALKNVLYAAQWLGGRSAEPVSIEWQDGLPDDPQETAEVLNSRIVSRTMSLRRGLTVEGLRGDALEEEIKEIEADREAASVVSPFSLEPEDADDGDPDEE